MPYRFLYPTTIVLACTGIYTLSHSTFELLVAALFGVLGYFLRTRGFEPAPLLLGFVLSQPIEEHTRRALLFSNGDPTTFLTHPDQRRAARNRFVAADIVGLAVAAARARRAPQIGQPARGVLREQDQPTAIRSPFPARSVVAEMPGSSSASPYCNRSFCTRQFDVSPT